MEFFSTFAAVNGTVMREFITFHEKIYVDLRTGLDFLAAGSALAMLFPFRLSAAGCLLSYTNSLLFFKSSVTAKKIACWSSKFQSTLNS